VTIINSVTPKVGAKHELLFNKPASAFVWPSSVTKLDVCGNNWFKSVAKNDNFFAAYIQLDIFCGEN
jgi:hypothetical protein